MQAALVLTVIGRDRPGLVEALASLVNRHGGNWLESRMNRLGGEFAGILRLTVPAAAEAALRHDLDSLGTSGLTVLVRRDDATPAAPAQEILVQLVGADRPGIVRQIAAAFARHGANVEELVTECVSAPMSGEPLFRASARLALPPGCTLADIRADLDRAASDLVVDLEIRPVDGTAAV